MIMRERRKILEDLNIDKTWTLFLDRDGVINKKIEGDYVRTWEQFELLPGVIQALKILNGFFGRIIIVTNQRGVGKGLMSIKDLENIHNKMLCIFESEGIKIDAIYYCPHDYEKEACNCRKPNIGMALQAKRDFPEIIFEKSIMVGDSVSDIEFGDRLNMKSFLVGSSGLADFKSLHDFALCLFNLKQSKTLST